MTIEAIRFRAEGALIALQVKERKERVHYSYDSGAEWRDATVEDLLAVARFTSALDVLEGMVNRIQLHVESSQACGNPNLKEIPGWDRG